MVKYLIIKKVSNLWYATWQSNTVCLEFQWRYQFVGITYGESKAKTFDTTKLTFIVLTLHLMKKSYSLKDLIINSTMLYSLTLIYNKASKSSSLTTNPTRFQDSQIWWTTFRELIMRWKWSREKKLNSMMWLLGILRVIIIFMNKMKSKKKIKWQKMSKFITKDKLYHKPH